MIIRELRVLRPSRVRLHFREGSPLTDPRLCCLLALTSLMLGLGPVFSAASAGPLDIVISEVLYHPGPENLGDEYLELHNHGDAPVDLSGWILEGGIDFVFPVGTSLAGQAYLVVARDALAAKAYYGISNLVGNYAGRLDNAGDVLRLKDSSTPRQLIDLVEYGDEAPWPPDADGGGASIELVIPESDNARPENWGIGQPYSPGGANNPAHAEAGAIVINEIMYLPQREEKREKFDASHAGPYQEIGDDEFGEYVELFNRSSAEVNLAGWVFSDGIGFRFADGVRLAPNEYLVVAGHPEAVQARFGITNVVGPFTGTLADGGERITLRDAQDRIVDTVRYGDRAPWPTAPDDLGYSLECLDPDLDNSSAANWRSSRKALTVSLQQPWQVLTVNVRAASDQLVLLLPSPGEWLIDGVEVRSSNGGANLLANGSFESDLAGWTAQGNHAGSRRAADSASSGTASLLLAASGPGDLETNLLRSAPIPGLVVGQEYTITLRAVFRKGSESINLGFLDAGSLAARRAAGGLHQLANEWSDTLNPSYGWSYRQRSGALITTRVARWRTSDLGGSQPAWTAGGATGAPGWSLSTGSSSAAGAPHPDYDFPKGTVLAHGPAEVWWTAESDQRITIAGGVWLLRHIGRNQHWYIKHNDTEITAGDLLSADATVASGSPLSFATGSGGAAALLRDVRTGDILKFGALPLAPSRTEDYVGYDISLSFGQATAPPINKPPLAGFRGRGTPGSANSTRSEGLPPFLEDLQHSPERPRSTNQVQVTVRVNAEVPLLSVRLITSLNLVTNETTYEMFDDGAHGDGGVADGVFGTLIPAQKSQTLVHYRVAATDSAGATTTLPYPDDPSPTQAFFSYDGEVKTGSTLFHLFITPSNIAILDADPNTEASVDCSLVIDQIAYPHIGANYRGRGSRNNPKRPWKFKFNKNQPYHGNHSYDTMFSVPLEQELAFEVFDSAGVENLEHEPVRLHINGSFWGWYIGFESPTASWLSKHGYASEGEVYKARTVETANQWKNSDLYHNQIATDYDYWGAYNKKIRPLEPPTELRELVNALNDLPDAQLLPWLDAHLDIDQWFKRWALNICMNIDDFAGHNFYMFLPGEPGGKWKMLAYDFDSGFTFGRVGPLRALYGDGGNGDSPAWQRNKLYQRVSANPTLRRIYLLTLRTMVDEVMQLDRLFTRLDELFVQTAPDRIADLGRWSTVRSSTTEAKEVLTSQRRSLSNYLASASTGLPGRDKAPSIVLPSAEADAGSPVQITTPSGWQAYYTLDGTDPRLSPTRLLYTGAIPFPLTPTTLKASALPAGAAPASGNWTDLIGQTLNASPRPRLGIQRLADSIRLSWGVEFTNQVLETTTTLPGPWLPVPAPTIRDGNRLRVDQTLGNAPRFFRLK